MMSGMFAFKKVTGWTILASPATKEMHTGSRASMEPSVRRKNTFLGSKRLQWFFAGKRFLSSLSEDPNVVVGYSKSSVRRASTNVIQKRGSCVYTRRVMPENTKAAGRLLDIMVLDHVPVRKDERLRVDILKPRGFKMREDRVKADKEIEDELRMLDRECSVRGSVYFLDGARVLPRKYGD